MHRAVRPGGMVCTQVCQGPLEQTNVSNGTEAVISALALSCMVVDSHQEPLSALNGTFELGPAVPEVGTLHSSSCISSSLSHVNDEMQTGH